MSIVLIVIYCLMAVLFLFGLTFHDELQQERRRKRDNLIVIDGDKRGSLKMRRHP